MASWKKIIVSGSSAELSSLSLDTALPVAQGGIGASSLTDKAVLISQDSGTDAVGALALTTNGSIIVGGTNGPAVEAAADVAGTGLTATTGDGTLVINVDAAQTQITSVGTLGTGAISSGFGNIDNGTSTLNTGNATVDNLTNASAVADSHITGSFTGSFVGDGTNLTGVTAAVDIDSLSAAAIAQTDLLIFSDAGTESKITFSDFEDTIFGAVSGDATVAAGGALTIAADSVEGTMLNTNAADTSTIELSSDTLSVLKVPNALTVDNATIALNSGTTYDGSGARTISIKDGGVDADALAAAVAGNGLTGGGGSALAVGAGTGVTVNANDIAIGQAIGTGDSPTFTNLTLSGDLTVNGSTTTVNTANLLVEDRFILVNSGSNATGDGGLVVGSGSLQSGSTFIWDDSADRWGTQHDTQLKHDATTSAPEAYASLYVLTANTGSTTYGVKGNIKTDDTTGDIFIYS
jgi:hypothetical protein